ncbi:hypothetical protein LTR66_001495 [Elasticomyces elasticus]|nr:hypothetical protein LTR28_003414 [Elasticomyces elasticus]KAK4999475.1 hypothetical protein LTR66_001495 [Elasticomyces elasticus]
MPSSSSPSASASSATSLRSRTPLFFPSFLRATDTTDAEPLFLKAAYSLGLVAADDAPIPVDLLAELEKGSVPEVAEALGADDVAPVRRAEGGDGAFEPPLAGSACALPHAHGVLDVEFFDESEFAEYPVKLVVCYTV